MYDETITLIIKLTEKCNLNCQYCFLDFGDSKRQESISIDTVDLLFKKILSAKRPPKLIDCIWHGGEPLLFNLNEFKNIIQIQNVLKIRHNNDLLFKNSIQTNGTLINQSWIDFFKQNRFEIGVSIDYPSEYHNRVRTGKSNCDFKSIKVNLEVLIKNGINAGAITVISNQNIHLIAEIYNFFKQVKIPFRPNIYFPDNFVQDDELVIPPKTYSKYLTKLFDLWYFDESPITIDIFEDIIYSMVTKKVRACIFSGECYKYLSVRPSGDIYICDRFNTDDFKVGRVKDLNLENLETNTTIRKFKDRISHLKKCSKCEWMNICNGGCPTYSYSFKNTIFEPDYYCEARKDIFNHIYNLLIKDSNHGNKRLISERIEKNQQTVN
jgi:uncharacterized protein